MVIARTVAELMDTKDVALISALGTVLSVILASIISWYTQRTTRERDLSNAENERIKAEAEEEAKHVQAQAEVSRTVIGLLEPQRKELELQRALTERVSAQNDRLSAQLSELDCRFRQLQINYREVVRGARALSAQLKGAGIIPVWEPPDPESNS